MEYGIDHWGCTSKKNDQRIQNKIIRWMVGAPLVCKERRYFQRL